MYIYVKFIIYNINVCFGTEILIIGIMFMCQIEGI